MTMMQDVARNNYQYNGKELADDLDLGWYFYGARMSDPAIGRFTGVDPIGDRFAWVSTYNYAENMVPMAIDLWGLQAWVVKHGHESNGNTSQTWEFDGSKEPRDGVYVEHNHYDKSGDLAGGSTTTASYSEYPYQFPNFSRGYYDNPQRKDGKSWISTTGHLKLTYGSLGVSADFLGQKWGGFLKSEGDLFGFTLDSDEGGLAVTHAVNDKTLEVGFEAGYYVGIAYFREFDRTTGYFIDNDELEYSAGSPYIPANFIINTKTNEASVRIGAGVKIALGFGMDGEFYFNMNPKKFSSFEKKVKDSIKP